MDLQRIIDALTMKVTIKGSRKSDPERVQLFYPNISNEVSYIRTVDIVGNYDENADLTKLRLPCSNIAKLKSAKVKMIPIITAGAARFYNNVIPTNSNIRGYKKLNIHSNDTEDSDPLFYRGVQIPPFNIILNARCGGTGMHTPYKASGYVQPEHLHDVITPGMKSYILGQCVEQLDELFTRDKLELLKIINQQNIVEYAIKDKSTLIKKLEQLSQEVADRQFALRDSYEKIIVAVEKESSR